MILYDKPRGVTSHDVVASVRRRLGVRRVGHAGTLDPFATGLLLVLVGRATRAQWLLTELRKEYEAIARLGARSSTGDPEGEIETTGRVPPPARPLPTGELRQRPPVYSAIKIDGERAYRRARRGEQVEMPERTILVYRFEQLWREGDERAAYAIECSSGTYVRSLIADLGDAYCERLRRVRIGPFDVAEADPLEIIPLNVALARFVREWRLDAEQGRRAATGQPVPGRAEGIVRLTDPEGLVALAEPRGAQLKPIVGFRG